MDATLNTVRGGVPGTIPVMDALRPGAKAGPWVVERELGRGGMGAVYAVVHEEIGKRAALKIVHARLVGTSFNPARMLVEARVVNQVGHPNIVDIFETGTLADGRPYIVMERLDGQPLSQRADSGKIRPDLVVGILLQVCDALIAAHAAGVVHRDLKLDNVFLVDNPDDPRAVKVKLLDWGIAKLLHNDARHTFEGQLVGTPQYLAPEQARGAEVSPKADVYSLGVMAYELFLEQRPFEAETAAEIMVMHLRATPPPPRALWADIPPQLEALLLAMLAKQPGRRPTMREVAHQLEAVRAELDHHCSAADAAGPSAELPRPVRRISVGGFAATEQAERPRTPGWPYAIGAIALLAGAALFLVSRSDHSAAAAPPPAEAEFTDLRAPAVSEVVEAPAPAATPAQDPPEAPATPPPPQPPPAATASTGAARGATPRAAAPPAAATPRPPRTAPPPPAQRGAGTRAASPRNQRAPAEPRRTKQDPNGTIDPFQ